MTLPACQSNIGNSFGATNVPQGQTIAIDLPVQGDPTGFLAYRGAVEVRDAVQLASDFNLQILMASGPGPVYTDELVVVQLSGVHTAPIVVQNTVAANTVMPHAGRPFNHTTDIFRVRGHASFTGAAVLTSGWGADICATNDQVADCCAQLNAKLDQLLQYVSQVYVNAP